MRNGICRLYEYASCLGETLTDTQYKVKTIWFCFWSYVGVFLLNIIEWWVKDLRYTYHNVITNSTSLYCNGICMRQVMGSTASGSWENYHMMHEYMSIAYLFLNKFIKLVNFLWNSVKLDDNSRYFINR
jgi:hypothetical protein